MSEVVGTCSKIKSQCEKRGHSCFHPRSQKCSNGKVTESCDGHDNLKCCENGKVEAKPTIGDRLQNYGNYCGQFNGLGDSDGNGKAEWYSGIEPEVTNKVDGFCKEHDRCLLNPGKGCECDRKLCQQLSGSNYCKDFGCREYAFRAKNLMCIRKPNCQDKL